MCSYRKWCHSWRCPLPKCSEGFFFFRCIFSCHFIFLFPDSVSDHLHLPSSQHLCPHKVRGRTFFFLYKMNILSSSVTFSADSYFLYFFIITSSLHLFGLISSTLHHASPRLKSPALRTCLWSSNKTVMALTVCHLTVDSALLIIHARGFSAACKCQSG